MTTETDPRYLISTAQRTDRKRSVKLAWPIETITENGAEKTVMAVLAIVHHKAGINYATYEETTEDYFSVSINSEKVERLPDGGSVTQFRMFSGTGILRIPAGNRFTAKKLRDAVSTGYARFRELYEAGDERVTGYFEKGATA